MENKWISKFLIYTIAVMILVPIITNELMFIKTYRVAEDSKTWIGFIGSFWGAIIGGVIAGAITLIGVRMTIQNQKNEEFIRIYPQMMLLGNEISDSLKHFLEEIEEEGSEIYQTVFKYKSISEKNLVNSTKVNGFVYENYRDVHGYFYYFDKEIRDNSTYDDYGHFASKIRPEKIEHYKKLIKAGLEKHDKLVLNISNTYFDLTIIDSVEKKYKKQIRKLLKKVKKNTL